MEDSGVGAIIKLKSMNYALQRPLMEDLLKCKDLFDQIEEKGVKPVDVIEKE